jgi:RND family efflux transporter MFP subunit
MNLKKSGVFLLVMAFLFIAVSVGALPAEDNAAASGTPCPKKVAVVVETVKPAIFQGYQYFSGQGQAEIVAVISPVSGMLSEIMVSEGSLVDAGQDLAVLNAGLNEEVKKLEMAAAKAKKILAARQNWKEKSEPAVQAAAREYQKALDLLNNAKAQTNQVVKAPVAGIVHLVKAAGAEISANDLLLEISNPRQMVFKISLGAADKGTLSAGDKFIGTAEGTSAEVEAEIVALSETHVTFRVNNDRNQVKEGVGFTFMKLKAEYAEAIAVPFTAILKDSLGPFVYVAEKKKAKKMYVTLGDQGKGKTMIEKGLVAGEALIVSGFDCLIDGKKIRIVNQEEMEKEEAEIRAKEKESKPIQAEIKVTEPEVKAETGKAGDQLFMVGLTFERFTINDKNMREYYSNWFQHIPGLELSYQAFNKFDVWFSGKYYSDTQTTAFYEDTVKFTLLPFSLGLRFRPTKMGSFEPFIGAGVNVYYYMESISGESDLANTTGLALGFHFQGGTYIYFTNFLKSIFLKHNRTLLGEIFVKYNIVSKSLAELTPDGADKLDLGGLEMGIGLVVKF